MGLPLYALENNPPTGNGEPHGIIYNIREKVGLENVEKFIIPTTNRVYPGNAFDITKVLKWTGLWSSDQYLDAYLQIEFKNRFVHPSYYSLKGNKGWEYPKEWCLYGFNKPGEQMTLISENTAVGSTYCSGGELCASSDWGTFQITKGFQPFRYLRFTIKTPSKSRPFINFCGIEVFGFLIAKKNSNCIRPQHHRITLIAMIVTYIPK